MKVYKNVGDTDFLFELSGGHLAVDFANTLGNRSTDQPTELLQNYRSLVNWARQAGVLDATSARKFVREATRRKDDAEVARVRGIALREALFSAFAAVAAGRPMARESLATLNGFLAEAMGHLRLRQSGRGLAWGRADEDSFDSLSWPVAQAAAELLTSEASDIGRLRQCDADDCAWLFLDTSKNGRRRWCDMSLCGNRAKNRRYYQDRRGQRRSPPVRAGKASR